MEKIRVLYAITPIPGEGGKESVFGKRPFPASLSPVDFISLFGMI